MEEFCNLRWEHHQQKVRNPTIVPTVIKCDKLQVDLRRFRKRDGRALVDLAFVASQWLAMCKHGDHLTLR
jgi:hypothetical protein